MAQAVKKQALGRGLSALLKDPENDIKIIVKVPGFDTRIKHYKHKPYEANNPECYSNGKVLVVRTQPVLAGKVGIHAFVLIFKCLRQVASANSDQWILPDNQQRSPPVFEPLYHRP